MITMQEIREKSVKDLQKELGELASRLREHRFAVSIQQERNSSERAKMRRAVARIKAELAARAQG